MNPIFVILIILISIVLWAILAVEFKTIGSIVKSLLENVNNAIDNDSDDDDE